MSQAFGIRISLFPFAYLFLCLFISIPLWNLRQMALGINPKQMLGSSDSFISIVDDVFGATSIAIYFHLGDRFRLLPLLHWVKFRATQRKKNSQIKHIHKCIVTQSLLDYSIYSFLGKKLMKF